MMGRTRAAAAAIALSLIAAGSARAQQAKQSTDTCALFDRDGVEAITSLMPVAKLLEQMCAAYNETEKAHVASNAARRASCYSASWALFTEIKRRDPARAAPDLSIVCAR